MLLASSNYFKSGDDGFLFPLSSVYNKAQRWANLRCSHMKRKMTLYTYCYDCGHLFINFPFFELLGKFYCFIMKRKHAPISILETESTNTLANDHFDHLYGAALKLPMYHRVFDDLFGGGSFYDGLGKRLIFFEHFLRTVIVLASLYLPLNKCVTLARLALSHRQTKML